jgi:hypothetical protein
MRTTLLMVALAFGLEALLWVLRAGARSAATGAALRAAGRFPAPARNAHHGPFIGHGGASRPTIIHQETRG